MCERLRRHDDGSGRGAFFQKASRIFVFIEYLMPRSETNGSVNRYFVSIDAMRWAREIRAILSVRYLVLYDTPYRRPTLRPQIIMVELVWAGSWQPSEISLLDTIVANLFGEFVGLKSKLWSTDRPAYHVSSSQSGATGN